MVVAGASQPRDMAWGVATPDLPGAAQTRRELGPRRTLADLGSYDSEFVAGGRGAAVSGKQAGPTGTRCQIGLGTSPPRAKKKLRGQML